MRETEVKEAIRSRLKGLLENIPFLEAKQTVGKGSSKGMRPDFTFDVMTGGRSSKIVVEVKSVGEPRQVRYAIQQLKEYVSRFDNAYGVVAAPYISSDTARLCKESGVGYIDMAGNSLLNFSQAYIEQRGYLNPWAERRQLRSIFTPKSSRILRVMLTNPRRGWQVQELAQEADVSLGLASKVKKRLLELEYARDEERTIILSRPEELLDKWADNYSFRKNTMYDYFSFTEPRDMERRLARYCKDRGIRYALTLFSGTALVAPFARYTRGFAYVGNSIGELAASLELKEVASGPNFTILEPYDEGIFYGIQNIEGVQVACDTQLYLDLVGYKGRGEESAKFLLEQRIKPTW